MSTQRIRLRQEHGGWPVLEVDGKELRGVTRFVLDVGPDKFPEFVVTMIAAPYDFDAEGRFVPLLDLLDADTFEEPATRELYERLKARFEPED